MQTNIVYYKNKWPELLYRFTSFAKSKIQNDCPNIKIEVIHPDSIITMDYRRDRVMIVSKYGVVVKVPVIG